jgi:plasmid stabilization system protein ParE
MYVSEYTDAATLDVTETLEYIAYTLNAPIASRNLYYEIDKKIKEIEDNPYSCPLVRNDYLANKGFRWLGIKNYMMFYVVDEKHGKIYLIRFLYGRRDWINILKAGIENNNK